MNPIEIVLRQLELGDVILGICLGLLLSIGLARLLEWVPALGRTNKAVGYRRFAWQIAAVLGLEQAYEFTRGQIPHETDVALINAYRVLDLEWSHGFFVESRIERFFLQFGAIMNAVDAFYIAAHVLVTIGMLVWLYTRRREHYPFARNMLMVTTAIALVVFYVYPTAPPRLLSNYGFVDPVVLHHLVGEGGAQAASYTYNPYAAMPSLHVAYALVSAWALFLAARNWAVRLLAMLYPLTMGAVVIISGNHWVLDVIGAGVTVLVARALLYSFGRVHALVRAAPGLFFPFDNTTPGAAA